MAARPCCGCGPAARDLHRVGICASSAGSCRELIRNLRFLGRLDEELSQHWVDIRSELDNRAFAEAEFRQLIGDSTEGTLARFLDNKLKLMFWYRPPRDPSKATQVAPGP